jgi:cellulose biosynthesis protein BcsQ
MDNAGIKNALAPNSQKELANDVALLFSWAKIENAPYRDFSRQRPSLSSPGESGGRKNQDVGVSEGQNKTITDPASSAWVTRHVSNAAMSDGTGSQQSADEIDQAIRGRRLDASVLPIKESPDAKRVTPPGFREAEASGKAPIVVAVYSMAGGVGKTSICANLGKTLCSLGEQLLLVDATSRGLLPFYFGATELRTGPRKFLAPGANAPFIQVIAGDEITTQWIDRDVKHLMASAQRTIIDLGQIPEAPLHGILRTCSVVLVPLLPDFNSISTVLRIENMLHAQAVGSNPPAVFYLFNRFDQHRINDQRARDFVEQHCGHRLLPISLRPDSQLTEALREGLPGVPDQTPGAELSHDYLELALWLRRVAPLRSAALVAGRWSEQ